MNDVVADFRTTVESSSRALLELSEPEAAARPGPGKWSPKEIVGHLIDSAANNHRRFVLAQIEEELVFPGYQQEAWVRAQNYQDASWVALVELWRAYNLHLARVMECVPERERARPRRRHNLHEIAFGRVSEAEPASLELLMRDYVVHLKHHVAQILAHRSA